MIVLYAQGKRQQKEGLIVSSVGVGSVFRIFIFDDTHQRWSLDIPPVRIALVAHLRTV